MVGLRKQVIRGTGTPDGCIITLKQGPVRMELQNTLTNQHLTERELIREVGRVVAKEKQHRTKMTEVEEVAYVDEVEAVYGRSDGKKVQETRLVDQEILDLTFPISSLELGWYDKVPKSKAGP